MIEELRVFLQQLDRLHNAGLPLQHVLVLLRTYCVGSPTHHLRANLAPVEAYDAEVSMFLSRVLDHDLDAEDVPRSCHRLSATQEAAFLLDSERRNMGTFLSEK